MQMIALHEMMHTFAILLFLKLSFSRNKSRFKLLKAFICHQAHSTCSRLFKNEKKKELRVQN